MTSAKIAARLLEVVPGTGAAIDVLCELADLSPTKAGPLTMRGCPGPEIAAQMAAGSAHAACAIASRAEYPELLERLARDRRVGVRRAVAANQALPAHAANELYLWAMHEDSETLASVLVNPALDPHDIVEGLSSVKNVTEFPSRLAADRLAAHGDIEIMRLALTTAPEPVVARLVSLAAQGLGEGKLDEVLDLIPKVSVEHLEALLNAGLLRGAEAAQRFVTELAEASDDELRWLGPPSDLAAAKVFAASGRPGLARSAAQFSHPDAQLFETLISTGDYKIVEAIVRSAQTLDARSAARLIAAGDIPVPGECWQVIECWQGLWDVPELDTSARLRLCEYASQTDHPYELCKFLCSSYPENLPRPGERATVCAGLTGATAYRLLGYPVNIANLLVADPTGAHELLCALPGLVESWSRRCLDISEHDNRRAGLDAIGVWILEEISGRFGADPQAWATVLLFSENAELNLAQVMDMAATALIPAVV